MRRLLPVIAVLLCSAFAAATTVKPMSIEEMTAAASSIVEGQATESWSAWNAQHTLIYTFTRVHVSKTLKGRSQDSILLKQLGGNANGYTQKVAGVDPLRTGDQSVLFLRPSAAHDGTMVIVGLMQGNFRIARESRSGLVVVNNGVADVHQSTSGEVTEYRGAKLTLRQLEGRVRRAGND